MRTRIFFLLGLVVFLSAYKILNSDLGSKIYISVLAASAISGITYVLWRQRLPVEIVALDKNLEKKKRKLTSFLYSHNLKARIIIYEGQKLAAFSTQLFESVGSIYIPREMLLEWNQSSLEGVVLHESYHLQNRDPLKRFIRAWTMFLFFFLSYFFFERWLWGVMGLCALIELVYNRTQEYKADEFAFNKNNTRALNSLYSLAHEMNQRKAQAEKPLTWHPKVILHLLYNLIIVHGVYSLYLVYTDSVGMHPSVGARLQHLQAKNKDIKQAIFLKKVHGQGRYIHPHKPLR